MPLSVAMAKMTTRASPPSRHHCDAASCAEHSFGSVCEHSFGSSGSTSEERSVFSFVKRQDDQREALLCHGPHLQLAFDEREELQIFRPVQFRSNVQLHCILLVLGLLSHLLSLSLVGWSDSGLLAAAVVTVFLLVVRGWLHRWSDMAAAHRLGVSTWVATATTPVLLSVVLRATGMAGSIRFEPSSSSWGGAVIGTASLLAGLLHMSMAPTKGQTFIVLTVFCIGAITHGGLPFLSGGPLVEGSVAISGLCLGGFALGLLLGWIDTCRQRALYQASRRVEQLQGEKERAMFDYTQAVLKADQATAARPGVVTTLPSAASPPTSHADSDGHVLPPPDHAYTTVNIGEVCKMDDTRLHRQMLSIFWSPAARAAPPSPPIQPLFLDALTRRAKPALRIDDVRAEIGHNRHLSAASSECSA